MRQMCLLGLPDLLSFFGRSGISVEDLGLAVLLPFLHYESSRSTSFFAFFWGSLLAVEWIVVVLSLSQWCQCMTPIGIFFFVYPGAGAFTGRCRSHSAADAGGCCWTLQGIHCCSRCSPAYKPWNHFCGSAFEILGNENSLLSGAADRLTQWYVFWLICHDDTHILLSETY